MKHLVQFRVSGVVVIEQEGGVTTKINIERGVMCPANVLCFVVYDHDHYIEVADVELQEGLVRALPCKAFMFIDRMD